MTKRLYRSQDDRVLAGVCGGLGAYFGIDPTIVRVIAVLSVFVGAVGVIAYIILALVVPMEGSRSSQPREAIRENVEDIKETAGQLGRDVQATVAKEEAATEETARLRGRRLNWLALAVIVLGVVLLLGNFGVFWWFNWGTLWPVAVIAIGVLLFMAARRK